MINNILDIKTITKKEALNILNYKIDRELLSQRDNSLLYQVKLLLEQLQAKEG